MPTATWEKGMKKIETPTAGLHMSFDEVSRRSTILLKEKGWCAWQCAALNGDVIVIIRDADVSGFPTDLPVYTERELMEACSMGNSGLRLIHEAKKANLN